MKICGCHNVREKKEIKCGDKYVTLEISLKFDNMDNMKITSSELNGKLERSGKGLITSLCFKTKVRSQKYKKARYDIINVSKNDLSKIIREFEKLERLPCKKKRIKYELTDTYFYLARQVSKCMMISNTPNWHDYGDYTEMTAPSSNVYSTDEDKSKRIIVHKTLLHNYSADVG